MLEFLHGAPYVVCVDLKNFYLCVLFWRCFVCFVWGGGGYVKSWDGCCSVASYGSLCDGNMWGESGRVGYIRSRV